MSRSAFASGIDDRSLLIQWHNYAHDYKRLNDRADAPSNAVTYPSFIDDHGPPSTRTPVLRSSPEPYRWEPYHDHRQATPRLTENNVTNGSRYREYDFQDLHHEYPGTPIKPMEKKLLHKLYQSVVYEKQLEKQEMETRRRTQSGVPVPLEEPKRRSRSRHQIDLLPSTSDLKERSQRSRVTTDSSVMSGDHLLHWTGEQRIKDRRSKVTKETERCDSPSRSNAPIIRVTSKNCEELYGEVPIFSPILDESDLSDSQTKSDSSQTSKRSEKAQNTNKKTTKSSGAKMSPRSLAMERLSIAASADAASVAAFSGKPSTSSSRSERSRSSQANSSNHTHSRQTSDTAATSTTYDAVGSSRHRATSSKSSQHTKKAGSNYREDIPLDTSSRKTKDRENMSPDPDDSTKNKGKARSGSSSNKISTTERRQPMLNTINTLPEAYAFASANELDSLHSYGTGHEWFSVDDTPQVPPAETKHMSYERARRPPSSKTQSSRKTSSRHAQVPSPNSQLDSDPHSMSGGLPDPGTTSPIHRPRPPLPHLPLHNDDFIRDASGYFSSSHISIPSTSSQHSTNPWDAEEPGIYAGRGWISPHPLSCSSSGARLPPQSAITLPSEFQADNDEVAKMTYSTWKAMQEHGLAQYELRREQRRG